MTLNADTQRKPFRFVGLFPLSQLANAFGAVYPGDIHLLTATVTAMGFLTAIIPFVLQL